MVEMGLANCVHISEVFTVRGFTVHIECFTWWIWPASLCHTHPAAAVACEGRTPYRPSGHPATYLHPEKYTSN